MRYQLTSVYYGIAITRNLNRNNMETTCESGRLSDKENNSLGYHSWICYFILIEILRYVDRKLNENMRIWTVTIQYGWSHNTMLLIPIRDIVPFWNCRVVALTSTGKKARQRAVFTIYRIVSPWIFLLLFSKGDNATAHFWRKNKMCCVVRLSL